MNSLDVPTVSIVIPTFNRDKLLQETIQSVQKQTFENWEIIVVDDGSNDKTEGTMMHFSKSDSRIRYVQRNSSQKGASVCRNEGTELSRGDYVIYLDSDDLLSPTTLEYRLKAMEHYPDLDFGVFQAILFRDQPGDTRLLWNIDSEENDIDRFLALDIPWQTTSPIWRRKALLRLGPWNGSLPSWQDWEYHLRALIEGLKYKKFPIPDFFWRISAPLPKQHLLPFQRYQSSRESISQAPIPTWLRAQHLLLLSNHPTLVVVELIFIAVLQSIH